jgi:hypothetical protein
VATIAAVEHHVNELQEALIALARQNDRTARAVEATTRGIDRLSAQNDRTAAGLDRLSEEMREFKNEMAVFKNEMREFKNEMAVFKNEMGEFKNETRKSLAGLSKSLGTLAEDILGPSIPTLFRRFFPEGAAPDFAMRTRRHHKSSGQEREFDTPAWNDKVFLFSETKARLRPEDLDSFAETIAEVRNFFPVETAGKKVCAAMASLYIDPTLVKGGEKRGFLMIALGNNLAEVMNSDGFKPAEF